MQIDPDIDCLGIRRLPIFESADEEALRARNFAREPVSKHRPSNGQTVLSPVDLPIRFSNQSQQCEPVPEKPFEFTETVSFGRRQRANIGHAHGSETPIPTYQRPGRRRSLPESGSFCSVFGVFLRSKDNCLWLVVDAVCREPVSNPNRPITGKNTGKIAKLGLNLPSESHVT
jgi:hypothetical protein